MCVIKSKWIPLFTVGCYIYVDVYIFVVAYVFFSSDRYVTENNDFYVKNYFFPKLLIFLCHFPQITYFVWMIVVHSESINFFFIHFVCGLPLIFLSKRWKQIVCMEVCNSLDSKFERREKACKLLDTVKIKINTNEMKNKSWKNL